MQNYEYQVCSVQYGRVTFVNGVWRGRVPLSAGDTNVALESCPNTWDYLQEAGRDGWELVAVVTHPNHQQPDAMQDMLYLKRPSW
jgi:hypothetical protein